MRDVTVERVDPQRRERRTSAEIHGGVEVELVRDGARRAGVHQARAVDVECACEGRQREVGAAREIRANGGDAFTAKKQHREEETDESEEQCLWSKARSRP